MTISNKPEILKEIRCMRGIVEKEIGPNIYLSMVWNVCFEKTAMWVGRQWVHCGTGTPKQMNMLVLNAWSESSKGLTHWTLLETVREEIRTLSLIIDY
jgi:hypothetical protein